MHEISKTGGGKGLRLKLVHAMHAHNTYTHTNTSSAGIAACIVARGYVQPSA